jgi:hypothetical protein
MLLALIHVGAFADHHHGPNGLVPGLPGSRPAPVAAMTFSPRGAQASLRPGAKALLRVVKPFDRVSA